MGKNGNKKIGKKIIHLLQIFLSPGAQNKAEAIKKNTKGFSKTETQTAPFSINLLHAQHFPKL